ncbi:hypothetical protein KGF56_001016 [Candida oxycetoniae]|uniref:Nucleolar 27S pre-rRNA processing Urb2/Npa2 C-terminal domain-containing protein n=1 Tax=Candida oxycetoniae TaxID=497107 RepID=A0AAI9WZK9_9ASCO|nr:uncharacterized protein KGF56_001016 [Candida oxycetoniae]KAI3406174.2 hypothetical protein KGF56_001016 [Candida oxycetoniae]
MSAPVSAETITRLLRSKDEKLDTIVKYANKVLDKKSFNIYFPKSGIFILKLLVDRLNDRSANSKFSEWKFSVDVWDLFIKTWQSLGVSDADYNDVHTRDRIVQSLKIFEITTQVLNQITPETANCLPKILDALNMLMNYTYVEVDEPTGFFLLKGYLSALVGKTVFRDIDAWSQLVVRIYLGSCSRLGYEGSKKSYNKFFEECLLPLIEVVVVVELSSSSSPGKLSSTSKSVLKSLLVEKIFAPEYVDRIPVNLEKLLSKHSAGLDSKAVLYLYALVVEHLASKSIKECEQIYVLLSSKYKHLSEDMLGILVNSKKPISSDFTSAIYKSEIADKKFIDLNWSMVKYIFEVDSELATKKSKFIFEKYNSAFKLDDQVLAVGKVVVDAYVENRELFEFFTKVWPKAIKKDEVWESDEFVSKVATTISSLSGKQLSLIIEESFKLDTIDMKPILTAITSGMMMMKCTWKIIDYSKDVFLRNENVINLQSDFWQVRYNLLCLYGLQFKIPESILNSEDDLYFYYTILRLVELGKVEEVTDSQQFQIVRFMSALQTLDTSAVVGAFKRWFVIFNDFFSAENVDKLILLAMNSQALKDIPNEFFEQRRLVSATIRHLVETPIPNDELIRQIPLACYTKGSKREILDKATKVFIQNPSVGWAKSIKYLLSIPSYQSLIESDFSILLQVIERSSGEWELLISEITYLVWTSNLNQRQNGEPTTYVIDVIMRLTSVLNSTMMDPRSPEIQLALVISGCIAETPLPLQQKVIELHNELLLHCTTVLKSSTIKYDDTTMVWYLQALASRVDPSESSFAQVQEIVKNINLEKTKNDCIRSAIFKLVGRAIPVSFNHAIYLLALYMATTTTTTKSNKTAEFQELSHYLERVARDDLEVHTDVFRNFIGSAMASESNEFVNDLIMIACSFLSTLTKDTDSKTSASLFSFLVNVKGKNVDFGTAITLLETVKTALITKSGIFTQYILELTLNITNHIFAVLCFTDIKQLEKVYITATQVISCILLYHRYKLSTRHHLLISIMSSFLNRLSMQSPWKNSVEAASSYARLLNNICEPSERIRDSSSSPTSSFSSSTATTTAHLTTSANLYKKSLRKHLSVLMSNYVYFHLKFNYSKQVNDVLTEGIYSMFNILSQNELETINASLDYAGKALFKSLYNSYKDHGKWKA